MIPDERRGRIPGLTMIASAALRRFLRLADRCEEIAKSGGVIRIYRLRYGVAPESICCEC
jgi:hypothetical protein